MTALRGWLAERVADADRDDGEEERARRLESDAEAVQVLTIHRSKGLEFPVVYCPFLWDPTWIRSKEPVAFHDPATGYKHTVDVGLEGRTFKRTLRPIRDRAARRGPAARVRRAHARQASGRDLVGGTTVQPQLAARAAAVRQGRRRRWSSAYGDSTPADAAVVERFRELAAARPGGSPSSARRSRRAGGWSPSLEPPVDLAAARFDRRLDLWWRRTSYTDITAEAHDPLVASEPERPVLSDEPETRDAGRGAPGSRAAELERESPLGTMPVGGRIRDVRPHRARSDRLRRPDLETELAERVAARARAGRSISAASRTRSCRGCGRRSRRRSGRSLDGLRLRDVARADRLDELEFELPLAGRRHADRPADARRDRRRAPSGSCPPAIRWPVRGAARGPGAALEVRGFLTGSIDLVDPAGEDRAFAVVDYKTNWLGPAGEPLTLAHYQPEVLAAEMSRAHYGLQALLYTVALHRYLRWRLPGYDPGPPSGRRALPVRSRHGRAKPGDGPAACSRGGRREASCER